MKKIENTSLKSTVRVAISLSEEQYQIYEKYQQLFGFSSHQSFFQMIKFLILVENNAFTRFAVTNLDMAKFVKKWGKVRPFVIQIYLKQSDLFLLKGILNQIKDKFNKNLELPDLVRLMYAYFFIRKMKEMKWRDLRRYS